MPSTRYRQSDAATQAWTNAMREGPLCYDAESVKCYAVNGTNVEFPKRGFARFFARIYDQRYSRMLSVE